MKELNIDKAMERANKYMDENGISNDAILVIFKGRELLINKDERRDIYTGQRLKVISEDPYVVDLIYDS